LLRSADLLFLPMQNLPPGRRSSTVPGKTYEYIASGRPILAAVPDGDAHDIIEAAGGNYLCRPDDVGGMVAAIEKALDNGTVERDEAALARFEYQSLAGQVGEMFSRVVELHRPPAPKPEQADPGPPPSRTVLHLAYFFPPIGGAGAQRSLKFVRYLPFFGYRSTVITGSGAVGGRWAPADDTLTDEIREAAEVDRVPGPEPTGASGLARRAERWFRVPTSWSKWWISGVLRVGQNDGPADAILASMSPYESAEAGARLAAERETPWIAGLRDPWALDEMMVFPSAVHRWRELRHMRRTLASAEAVVVTSEETVKQLRDTFPELRLKPIVSIPNGFDASDFEGEVPVRDDGVFRIVHTGYLHTELGRQQRRTAWLHRALGGQAGWVDILTRSHVFLLEAVEELLRRRPELRSRVEVHLAGVLSEGDREVADRSEAVRLHGYLPHAESIALLRSADLLFLPMQNLPPGRRSSTVPGKTYEYIASGRPILAAVPDGDAHDILEAVGTARFCRPGDSAAIADAILEQIDLWSRGDPLPRADPEVLQRFERRYLTAQLATLLDAVVALREPLPVSAESGGGGVREKLYAT
jgi:glycosyltransferase involved in cell wall biosynthesis